MQQHEIKSLFSVAEVELVYRNPVRPADRLKITDSRSAFDILIHAWDLNKIDMVEHFNILLLNRAHHCIGFSHIATGGISSCAVDPKIVFAMALKANASAIILAHNHPSGNLLPSKSDETLTKKFVEAGHFLDLPVVDHLIVTPLKYYSFAEEGLL